MQINKKAYKDLDPFPEEYAAGVGYAEEETKDPVCSESITVYSESAIFYGLVVNVKLES